MAEKRTLVSYKDLMIAVFSGGVAAIEALEGKYSKSSLRRAIKELKAANNPVVEDLENFFVSQGGTLGRGRGGPKIGDTRSYKVQQLKKGGGPFLRLPMDSLGVDKGAAVKVAFDEDTIVIKAA